MDAYGLEVAPSTRQITRFSALVPAGASRLALPSRVLKARRVKGRRLVARITAQDGGPTRGRPVAVVLRRR